MPTAPGPLGLILPRDMNQEQRDAHEKALAQMRQFALAPVDLPKGTKIILPQFWSDPKVIADIGKEFTGFGQYTGSCVGVSEGNALMTEICVQRCIADTPTTAVVPWWPHPYGRTRYNEGDRGQGEGAVDSIMGDTLVKEGWYAITEAGLPAFTKDGPEGWWLSKQIELQWSNGGAIAQKWIDLAKPRAGLTKTIVNDVMGIRSSIVNGYAILDGCDQFIGRGQIVDGGGEPYVQGHYDGQGGHSTCYLAVWNHPSDGYLYGYSNQWPTGTYPKDPAGLARCMTWVKEAEVSKLFRLGGDRGQTMSISNLQGLQPARPELLDYVY